MTYASPLRYPGGKSSIINYMKILLAKNNLYGTDYIEAYAGGAGVSLKLLFDNFVENIHLNDLNQQVYSFWDTALNYSDTLCQKISDTPVNTENWYIQKNIYNNPNDFSMSDVGFAFFYLNRTNRSGISNAGMIGGIKQKGKYLIDVRFNKIDLIKRLQKIAQYRDKIKLYNYDAIQFIKKIVPKLPSESIIYFDPPYYVKGHQLYDNFYKPKDHKKLSKLITQKVYNKWILSYDNVPEIHELYSEQPYIAYNLSYSSGKKYRGSEIMFFSDNLTLPNVKSPAYIPKKEMLEIVNAK